jgi:hypothetical protein
VILHRRALGPALGFCTRPALITDRTPVVITEPRGAEFESRKRRAVGLL